MVQILDPMKIYDIGLGDVSCLHGAERLVYMLQAFDNLMEMEAGTNFFIDEYHFAWYSEMKQWLHAIGDEASVVVLEHYEGHFTAYGVPFAPDTIERFLNAQDDVYLRACFDWRERYSELRRDRWEKAVAYLQSQGLLLLIDSPDT